MSAVFIPAPTPAASREGGWRPTDSSYKSPPGAPGPLGLHQPSLPRHKHSGGCRHGQRRGGKEQSKKEGGIKQKHLQESPKRFAWTPGGRSPAPLALPPAPLLLLLHPSPKKPADPPAITNKASLSSHGISSHCFGGRPRYWARTGAASQLQPTPPLRPRIKKQAAPEEEGEKENMPFPATLPAPAPSTSAAEALACWQPADWPRRSGKGSPVWCYWADLAILGGWREGGHARARAPASGRERAQGLFCDAGFQFASASALGHGVSCFLSHAAIWETAIGGDGDGKGRRGGVCLWLWVGAG